MLKHKQLERLDFNFALIDVYQVVPKTEPLCDRDYSSLVDVKPRPLPALRPEIPDLKNIHSSPAISWAGGNWQDSSRKSAFQPYRVR